MRTMSWLNTKSCAVFAIVAIAFFLGLVASGQSPPPEAARTTTKNRSLIERIEALEARDSVLLSLSEMSPPIGSVVAFAGEWPPSKPDGTKWTENELGWMLCDGRPLNGPQFDDVRAVLGGAVNSPDYQGYFLRGLGREGGIDSGRQVGSPQCYATALPQTPFVTDADSGKHKHAGLWDAPGDDSKIPRWFFNDRDANFWRENSGRKGTRPSLVDMQEMPEENGGHEHKISRGGDPETRPVNVAVHWIIKVSVPNVQ